MSLWWGRGRHPSRAVLTVMMVRWEVDVSVPREAASTFSVSFPLSLSLSHSFSFGVKGRGWPSLGCMPCLPISLSVIFLLLPEVRSRHPVLEAEAVNAQAH